MRTMKRDLSISDYLDKMNMIADNLALAGQQVPDDEVVQIIMNNLGPPYEMVVSAAQVHDTPITYLTIESLLQITERRMNDRVSYLTEFALAVVAFAANRGRGGGRSRGTGHGGVPSNRGTVPNSQGGTARGSFTNQRSYQQVGEASSSMNTQLVCQIYGKPGHPALDYYQRMNLVYECRIPAKCLTAMATSPTTMTQQNNCTWILDTGANAHVTHELQNLVNPKEYTGNENVGGVRNDFRLSISHFGSSTINTDSCSFHLNDVLHCPSASTNLISIHRFTSDNNYYILIFPDSFFVKDLKTQKTLFQGRCENRLYQFHSGGGFSNQHFQAFVGTRVTIQKWHSCLGHPASPIMKNLVSNKKVSITGSSNVGFCFFFSIGACTLRCLEFTYCFS